MSNVLAVFVNGRAMIEYHRDVPLPENQQEFLTRMDRQMDAGITLGTQRIENPEKNQRAQFVALQLVQAIVHDNEQLVAAACAYLAQRLPELKQIKANTLNDGTFAIDLVFSEAYTNQVQVSFNAPLDKDILH